MVTIDSADLGHSLLLDTHRYVTPYCFNAQIVTAANLQKSLTAVSVDGNICDAFVVSESSVRASIVNRLLA